MAMDDQALWRPGKEELANSNVARLQRDLGLGSYEELQRWSATEREAFWALTVRRLGIVTSRAPDRMLDLSGGVEQARWMSGARMNIVDSCFAGTAPALLHQAEGGPLRSVSRAELLSGVRRCAAGLAALGVQPGEAVAIAMPMTAAAVQIYLGIIYHGAVVVGIADSFAQEEIAVRLQIPQVRWVFTQDLILRGGKELELYAKCVRAGAAACVVLPATGGALRVSLRPNDRAWSDFLGADDGRASFQADAASPVNILFSSGTTGAPKAIAWDHCTPIKSASDAHYHHDLRPGDVVCWPTSLGWMMGPWLVFAALINGGTVALYEGLPSGRDFCEFAVRARVSMLGLVPSLLAHWKAGRCLEGLDWSALRCLSSTGECSSPEDMAYLMRITGRPVIEYCGGTETGGAYISSTLVQNLRPGCFSTPALGGDFVILDESGHAADEGEVFLIPPILGLSTQLLNADHHKTYYAGVPLHHGRLCRRHGDAMERRGPDCYRAHGRVDDAMNLGGIKVSCIQIEELVVQLPFVRECAAIAVPPPGGGPDALWLCLVPAGEAPPDLLQQLRLLVREHINPLFKVEQAVLVDSLPRTASNKVMRRELRRRFSQPPS